MASATPESATSIRTLFQEARVIPYTLPELDYGYADLEPHMTRAMMELHHRKHHAAYVKNANEAIARLDETRNTGDLMRMASLERILAFNVSGHILHSIFWKNLTPEGGGKPGGDLGLAIEENFGSFEHFRAQMTAVASTIMGSGWAGLVWEPTSGRLLTTQIYDHQSNLTQASVPLMVIDAWEHAYYLQYRNEKAKFFEHLWHLWNWKDIALRLEAARQLDLALTEAR
jgi:Fe-Mn family superoxide dismutase